MTSKRLLLMSLALTATLPLLARTPLGTLQAHLTDHVRHPHVVRVAMAVGARIYTTPFGELTGAASYPYPSDQWLDVPYMYPPGALLLFLPATLLGMSGALPIQWFGIIVVLYLLLLSHLAVYACWRALDGEKVSALLAWLVLVHVSLNGQYDAAWIGCGAMGFLRVRQTRPASALVWISLAALLHFRAVMLAPLGVYALIELLRTKQRLVLGFVALTGVLCGVTFVTLLRAGVRADNPPLITAPTSLMFWLAIFISGLAALAMWRLRERYAVAGILLTLVVALVDIPHWWHATLMLPVVLGIDVLGRSRVPLFSRGVALVWYVAMQPVVWNGSNPLWLFKDVSRYLALPGA